MELLGIKPEEPKTLRVGLDVDFRLRPIFEEKTLEHKDGHYIVQDWMGAITEISDEFDATYIRNARDFVTRKWHKFPVENREIGQSYTTTATVSCSPGYFEGIETENQRSLAELWYQHTNQRALGLL